MNQGYLIGLVLRQVNQETLMKGLLVSKRFFFEGLKKKEELIKIPAVGITRLDCAKYRWLFFLETILKRNRWYTTYTTTYEAYHMITENQRDIEIFLEGACLGGHLDLVELMIQLGAVKWNEGFAGACLGGHIEIARLMIDYGANSWNMGLYAAAKGGHLKMIHFMIQQNINWDYTGAVRTWDDGLYGACEGGHFEIAQWMIKLGASELNWALSGACKGNHLNLINLCIRYGANDWDWGLAEACTAKNVELELMMIKKGATYCYNCHNQCKNHDLNI